MPDDTAERLEVLKELEGWLEWPMLVLSAAWLVLVVIELVWGLSPVSEAIGTAIWAAFWVEFAIRLTLAPAKGRFLRRNWLTLIALLLPAVRFLRAFRVFRAARAVRGLRLVRLVGTVNRGMNALRRSMGRRGLGYVLVLSLLVLVLGAAGMLALEPQLFAGYGEALWWTAMMLTTMGSEAWPATAEGRVLCLLLALYAFGVFGFITAAFASFFVDRDAENEEAALAGRADILALRAELAALRAELAAGRPFAD